MPPFVTSGTTLHCSMGATPTSLVAPAPVVAATGITVLGSSELVAADGRYSELGVRRGFYPFAEGR